MSLMTQVLGNRKFLVQARCLKDHAHLLADRQRVLRDIVAEHADRSLL